MFELADVVTESLSDVMTNGLVNVEVIVPASCFVEVLADVNAKVSAAVMNAVEIPIAKPLDAFSC